MDYCVTESTLCEDATPRVETSVKDQLQVIEQKLYETDMTLKTIVDGLVGNQKLDDLVKEEKCMQETLFAVHGMADSCLGLSHKIKELLF